MFCTEFQTSGREILRCPILGHFSTPPIYIAFGWCGLGLTVNYLIFILLMLTSDTLYRFFLMNSCFLLLKRKPCVWFYVITLEISVVCSSIIFCCNMWSKDFCPTRDISLSSGTNKNNLLWCIGIEWSVTELISFIVSLLWALYVRFNVLFLTWQLFLFRKKCLYVNQFYIYLSCDLHIFTAILNSCAFIILIAEDLW